MNEPTPDAAGTPFFAWRDKLAFWIASALTLVSYLWMLQPSVGLEDSGEFITAAYHLGVPHPPGYPIWTIMAWVWQLIIPFGNIAWRLNLMSTVFGAVAIGLVAMLISKTGHIMGARVGFLHAIEERVVNLIVLASGVSAALMLAFSPVMLSQSVIAEVYSLNAFFLALTLVCLYRWSFEPERRWRLYLAAFIWGVSLTNHQTLVLLTIAFPAFVWFADRKLGRDALIPILAVIALGVVKMAVTKGSMVHQGPFAAAVVVLFGVGAVIWLVKLLQDKVELFHRWRQVLAVYGCVLAGLSLYGYMHLSSKTNPPMNWGYTSTWQGFVHHFTRGQYEKVHTDRDLMKFWGQLNMFFDDLQSQFSIVYLLAALACVFFYRELDRRDRDWLKFLLIGFLFLGLGFIFLSNPGFEKQKQFTDRVFFLPGHVIYALWIGYGLILGLGFLFSRKPAWRAGAPVAASVVLLLPLFSVNRNWSDNEQRNHYFGYEFGHLMFHPGGGYPDMDRDAVLFGGTDPGRFVPTYMIFVESFAPARAKTHLEKYPASRTFDRRDVYIITQNALADSTYMSYIRDHYDHSRPENTSRIQRWLGRDTVYPREPIWIPSERDSQAAFGQYVEELQQRQPLPEEQVHVDGGRVQVQGVQGVMAINGILTKMIFDKNKARHSFYVEESYVIPWMYPYLSPFGIILKINGEELPSPNEDPQLWNNILQRDRAYWDQLRRDLVASPEFRRDDVAQKTFSKLRSAIGGLYAFRGLAGEAERAYREAIELCPDSPEANFRLAQLYVQVGRHHDGAEVLRAYQARDPYSTKIGDAVRQIEALAEQTQRLAALEQQYAVNPNDLTVALQLVQAYAATQQYAELDSVVARLITREDLSPQDFMSIINLQAQARRIDQVTQLLTAFTTRFPGEPLGWFNLAALRSLGNDCAGAVEALRRALEVDSAGNIRASFPTDQRFANCRNDPGFQALAAGQAGAALPFQLSR